MVMLEEGGLILVHFTMELEMSVDFESLKDYSLTIDEVYFTEKTVLNNKTIELYPLIRDSLKNFTISSWAAKKLKDYQHDALLFVDEPNNGIEVVLSGIEREYGLYNFDTIEVFYIENGKYAIDLTDTEFTNELLEYIDLLDYFK